MATTAVALAAFLQTSNARTLVSWHGFLHTAIANRFPGSFGTPDNPFFAGEPLPYYWFYHYVAAGLAWILNTHPIYAFQILTAVGLTLVWIGAAAIGVRRFGSLRTGLLIAFIGLAGVNPLGPVIAIRKAYFDPQPMFRPATAADLAETRFVSQSDADQLMTHPLLGGLYVTADWRRGQNIPWFLDNSSRGLALGMVFPLLFVYLAAKPGWKHHAAAVLLAAAATALSPLIGLAVIGALMAGTTITAVFYRNSSGETFCLAALTGYALAAPTYLHMFAAGGSGMAVAGIGSIVARTVAVGFNVLILLPLAIWGCICSSAHWRQGGIALLCGGALLLMMVPVVILPDGTEHNLANTAYFLLAVPAAGWIQNQNRRSRLPLYIVAAFIPTSVATVWAFTTRPALPVLISGTSMERTADPAVEQLYRWIRGTTPDNAVFITDPSRPLKMSGNVTELPAFTGRSLFVDTPTYLTKPHSGLSKRVDLAQKLLSGEVPSPEEVQYLNSLRRPLYLLSYEADQPLVMSRLTQAYGPPVFHESFITAYVLPDAAVE